MWWSFLKNTFGQREMGHQCGPRLPPGDKFYEKDPFLGHPGLTNNNTGCLPGGHPGVGGGPGLCCDTDKHKCSGILLPGSCSTRLVSSLLRVSSSSISLVLGLSLTILGFLTFIVSPQLEAALTHLVQTWTALAGGPMLSAWLTPPIVPLLKVYVFNITNPAQVLEGVDPVTEELGPYVYSATHVRRIIEMDEKAANLQFKNKVVYQFLPELSAGSESDPLTVLNMVMMTAFNKVKSQPSFMKRGVVLPLLKSIGRPSPIVNVTVGGFLFGYEEDLACLGQIVAEPPEQDEDAADDFWDEDEEEDDFFLRRRRRSVPNYRDAETGKCLWGVLRDLNNTEHETVRIKTGQDDYKTKGTIVDMDGRTSFGAWQPECDSFSESVEPSTLPPGLGSNFSILVPVMCRTLALEAATTSHTVAGVEVTRYSAHPDSLQQDQCYCPNQASDPDSCLPHGYLSVAPCYPDISPPLAVSFPHGLHSPPSPLLTHAPAPDTERHSLYFDINNQLGVPLAAQVSFQISAVLRPDPSFPILDSIQGTRLVPLFWATEGFTEPSSWMVTHTKLALGLPLAASLGGAGGLLGLGLCCLAASLWRRRRASK